MGRYSPTVLPEAYSPLAGFLNSAVESGLSIYDKIQKAKDKKAEEARLKAADLRAEERQRQDTAQFEMAMAGMGAERTTPQTGRRGEVGSAIAQELHGPGAVLGGDPAAEAAHIAGAVNRTETRMNATHPLPTQGPSALSIELGPALIGPNAFQAVRTAGAMGPTSVAPGAGVGARTPGPVAPHQPLADYLGYRDRPENLRPYQAGEYTVDPVAAYDRSRSGVEESRMRQLTGPEIDQIDDPLVKLYIRAGRFAEAASLYRTTMQETGREARANMTDARVRELAGIQDSRVRARMAQDLTGRLGEQDARILLSLEDRVQELRLKRTALPRRQQPKEGEVPAPNSPAGILDASIATLEAQINAIQRAGRR